MYVLETGFRAVGQVVLGGGGSVAASKRFPTARTVAELRAWTAEFGNDFGIWEAKLWPAPGAEPQLVQVEEGDPFGLAIDPLDGSVVHGNSKYGVGWSDTGYSELDNQKGFARSFAISPDGKRVIVGCEWWAHRGRSGPADLLGLTRQKQPANKKLRRPKPWWLWVEDGVHSGDGFVFSHLAFLPDGKRFAAVEWSKTKGGTEYIQGDAPTLTIHDANSLAPLAAAKFKGPADGLAVCGELLVVSCGHRLRVWDATDLSAKPMQVKTGKTVAADPLGRFVLTAAKNTVRVWDTSSWTVANTFDWKIGPITCLAVSPDGTLAAAGSATGRVAVWDVE